MLISPYNQTTFETLKNHVEKIEEFLDADVIFYYGPIAPSIISLFQHFIENVHSHDNTKDSHVFKQKKAIGVFIRTGGGSAETTEQMVKILRHHYENVYFIVPDYAMSAGTILCMSGDKIYMDYSSALGPIDPQVPSSDDGRYVPAAGYLDKVKEISVKQTLTEADILFLRQTDLGKLAQYEQAHDLSIDLLTDWLVKYKFKDWTEHRTNQAKLGKKVTDNEKQSRAEQVAIDLADHKKWLSHSRFLDIGKLSELRIEIDDYSNETIREDIQTFNNCLTGMLDNQSLKFYLYHKSQPL